MTQHDSTKSTPSTTTATAVTDTTLDTGAGAALTRKHSVSVPGLHARLRNPIAKAADPNMMPNRIALMLDVSGSMDGDKIQSLRDATQGFVAACNLTDTSVALEPFSDGNPSPNRLPLTCFGPLLLTTCATLQAVGSTPMAQAMDYVINTYSVTRGVIVSDGEPDSEQACFDAALYYKEAGITVDCVHIGTSQDGERCLRQIAELTGGQYIKFTDVTSFSRSFKYLTPAMYGILCSGGVSAAELSAKELK